MPFLHLPHRIEYERYGPERGEPTLVLLHHGLGSVSAWRDFPARLAATTGLPVVAYSRRGYGRSQPLAPRARGADFMHREARQDLPALLQALSLKRPVLIGHSDGASIALIHAAEAVEGPAAVALLAPHVLVEDRTRAGAETARLQYAQGSLRAALARHHDDVDGAFRSWNETWLSESFRTWNIAGMASRLRCPVLLVQGLDDDYGTTLHVEAIAAGTPGPCHTLLLAGCGHLPDRERGAAVIAAIGDFVDDGATVPAIVYHVTTPEALQGGLSGDFYSPASLRQEGFVHCAGGLTVALAVAEDLFAGADTPPLLLAIRAAALTAPVRLEAPAPLASTRVTHRRLARSFPHVYGPVDVAAIEAVYRLEPFGARFALPAEALGGGVFSAP